MADHKVDDGLKKEIEAGKTLKDTPVPETGVNIHDATLAATDGNGQSKPVKPQKLTNVKTEEKVVLPPAEDIAAEEATDGNGQSKPVKPQKLTNVKTEEKVVLPPAEDIAAEKAASS